MAPNSQNLISMGHGNHLEELAIGGKVILEMILRMSKSDEKMWTEFV